jgi:hypothetical protein
MSTNVKKVNGYGANRKCSGIKCNPFHRVQVANQNARIPAKRLEPANLIMVIDSQSQVVCVAVAGSESASQSRCSVPSDLLVSRADGAGNEPKSRCESRVNGLRMLHREVVCRARRVAVVVVSVAGATA